MEPGHCAWIQPAKPEEASKNPEGSQDCVESGCCHLPRDAWGMELGKKPAGSKNLGLGTEQALLPTCYACYTLCTLWCWHQASVTRYRPQSIAQMGMKLSVTAGAQALSGHI